jgi:hypothetical protein
MVSPFLYHGRFGTDSFHQNPAGLSVAVCRPKRSFELIAVYEFKVVANHLPHLILINCGNKVGCPILTGLLSSL